MQIQKGEDKRERKRGWERERETKASEEREMRRERKTGVEIVQIKPTNKNYVSINTGKESYKDALTM